MEQEKKSKMSNSKKTTIILVIVLLLLAAAASFAYFFAILKGENINTAKTSSASIVYTEPEIGTETKEMTKYEGMTNATPYEFTVTGSSTGTSTLDYAVYVEELSGNTVDKSKVNYYLTDENNIPVFLGTTKPYNNMDMIITPDGENKYYRMSSDVTIKNSSNTSVLETTIKDEDMYTYLLAYYAKNVLKLTQNGTFNIENYATCYQVSYDSKTETATINDDAPLDNSSCTLKYETTEDENTYMIKTKSDDKTQYTATMSDVYMNFEDGTKFNGYTTEYIASKLNKNNQGDSFYVSNGYTAKNEYGEPRLLSNYCLKETKNEYGYFTEELADNSNCKNQYTIVIGEPEVHSIGERDNLYADQYEGISNILTSDTFNFENGQSVGQGQYGDAYLENRNQQSTKTYKLRYWISSSAANNGTTKEEVTPTTDGQTHTVEFGGSGVYKFKVNVYAKQSNPNE